MRTSIRDLPSPLILPTLLALGAFVGCGPKSVRPAPVDAATTIPVVQVSRFVPAGTHLRREHLTEVSVDPDMVVLDDTFRSADELVGRVPREHLLPHEPIRVERLAREGTMPGLAALVPPGLRAFRVELPHAHVRVFDLVDLVAGANRDGCTLLEAATVVHVERDALVVAITPEDALTLAADPPAHVLLRNVIDVAPGEGPSCEGSR